MLISTDSPLRCVPPTVETRTVLFLDGIRYSIEILDLIFHRLEKTLQGMAVMENGSAELASRIVEAISDAWATVDSANRLRGLVKQMPGLKQNDPNVQLFLRNIETVEPLRNFVQHFPSGIEAFVSNQMPLWGLLSWSRIVEETGHPQSVTIIPGTAYPGLRAYSLTFDRQSGHFLGRVVLRAGDHQIDLADLFDRVTAFSAWFEDWCRKTYHGQGHHAADVLIKMTMSDENP